jgi:hypothetical protein
MSGMKACTVNVLNTDNYNLFPKIVVFNLGYPYPRGYVKTSYINQCETQKTLEPLTSSDLRKKIRPRIEVPAFHKQAQSSH